MLNLARVRAVLLDMDGVLHRGADVLPGATDLAATMDALGLGYACLTNNSSQPPERFAAKLGGLGIPLPPNHVITSSTATGRMLRQRYPRGTRMLAIGMEGVRNALFGDGYFVDATEDVAAVVVGVDFDLRYETLRLGTLALRAGAAFIATNSDKTFPAPEGLIPGAGSLVAALEAASDRRAEVVGKPEPMMFLAALDLLGVSADEAIMVGDRLDTDIVGAQHVGIGTVFVESGVHTRAEAEIAPQPPDLILPNLAALLGLLRAAHAPRTA